MNAEDRGLEMMLVPMGKLPPVALAYLRNLAGRVGMCMEVCLTAWCTYAHVIEGFPLGPDDLYRPPQSEIDIIRSLVSTPNPKE